MDNASARSPCQHRIARFNASRQSIKSIPRLRSTESNITIHDKLCKILQTLFRRAEFTIRITYGTEFLIIVRINNRPCCVDGWRIAKFVALRRMRKKTLDMYTDTCVLCVRKGNDWQRLAFQRHHRPVVVVVGVVVSVVQGWANITNWHPIHSYDTYPPQATSDTDPTQKHPTSTQPLLLRPSSP